MKIALAGKGGVGKTTVAAALVRLFAEKGRRVFAVDADPDANLGSALGFPSCALKHLPPIVEMKDLVEERTGKGALLILNPDVDDILDRYRIQVGHISLFRMGGVKAAATQCYCKENAFLKALVKSLVLGRDDLMVIDFGAGIEHLTRGTAGGVDLLIVVTEPTRLSAESASTIARLGKDLGVPNVRVLGNKVRTDREREFLESAFDSELLGCVPYDEELAEAALEPPPGDAAGGETSSDVGAPNGASAGESPEDGLAGLPVGVLGGQLRRSLEEIYPEIVQLAGGSGS